ncbi:MAG: ABC transporter ATP-binding protein [Bacteroidales bacterium]|jgi:iron complex transport system ATP-binding protein|nr:ABC transporter ATP-binding protein [Bacteroidales bacterium]MDN5349263.1 cobalamin transport system ATP-binding protein [Bacteroidales bacterium]
MEMLRLKQLQIGYANQGKHKSSISLTPPIEAVVYKGEMVALTGPNGAGKSTLFRTIAGLHKALGGSIEIDGKSLNTLSLRQMSKLLSVVFTDRISDAYLNVFDVVATGRYPYINQWMKMSRTDRQIVHQSMEMTGITQFASKLFKNLSDGEQQKVLIAKALAQQTPLIILDEPAAFLDYPSKLNLLKLLKQLCDETQKTILLSSHDLEMIFRHVDKLWLMAPNLPLIAGSPIQLIDNKTIEKYFGVAYEL